MTTKTRPSIKAVRDAIKLQGYVNLPRPGRGPLRCSTMLVEGNRWAVDAGPGRIIPLTPAGRRILTEEARKVLGRKDEILARQRLATQWAANRVAPRR